VGVGCQWTEWPTGSRETQKPWKHSRSVDGGCGTAVVDTMTLDTDPHRSPERDERWTDIFYSTLTSVRLLMYWSLYKCISVIIKKNKNKCISVYTVFEEFIFSSLCQIAFLAHLYQDVIQLLMRAACVLSELKCTNYLNDE
jgi:hypothetical protein